jgi:Bacteriophage tail sheath protein
MPVTTSYPGVYIEEVPSGVRAIAGVSTSVTAFVGRALRGPVNEPKVLGSIEEYERVFGGLWIDSMLSYAVRSFFFNGGGQAIVVRVHNGAKTAEIDLGGTKLKARSPGKWGEKLRASVSYPAPDLDPKVYNLRVRDEGTGFEERFLNISADPSSPRRLEKVLAAASLVEPEGTTAAARPAEQTDKQATIAAKSDGDQITDAQLKPGVQALRKLENQIFNLLNIPPITRTADVGDDTLAEALALCVEKRAMLLVDPPIGWKTVGDAVTGMVTFPLSGDDARNATIYFPRLKMKDPQQEGRLAEFAPGGAVAGVMARTDQQRGVWKAPAGQDASLTGVPELSLNLTDLENGRLNPLGLNCLRAFPVIGRVVWGARTLRGADQLANEWKYLPVRRLALFIEESLYQGTQWVVFEPNDEPLWAQIRLNVSAFLQRLFRQGAFQGRSPSEAYFVKCDKETNPQADIDLGIVNIVVGFAPLKPAEFVILRIQQMAGQTET